MHSLFPKFFQRQNSCLGQMKRDGKPWSLITYSKEKQKTGELGGKKIRKMFLKISHCGGVLLKAFVGKKRS